MSNYQRSFEILWEQKKRPTTEHPSACEVSPEGDLGPCWDCMHCHDEAQRIEDALDAKPGQEPGRD